MASATTGAKVISNRGRALRVELILSVARCMAMRLGLKFLVG